MSVITVMANGKSIIAFKKTEPGCKSTCQTTRRRVLSRVSTDAAVKLTGAACVRSLYLP
jgi:hypothetical protein